MPQLTPRYLKELRGEPVDPLEGWVLLGARCMWKTTDGSPEQRDVDIEQPMGTVLLDTYATEASKPYRGELSVWKENDAYVFMKCGAAAGSEWAQAPEREDSVVIPCVPEKTVRDHLAAAVQQWSSDGKGFAKG